jgi:hypothetical protein
MKDTDLLSVKARFGAIEVELKREKDSDSFECKLTESFSISCFPFYGRWLAKMSGPWYDDCDPEGRGDSVEEAVAKLSEKAAWLCEQCEELQETAFSI